MLSLISSIMLRKLRLKQKNGFFGEKKVETIEARPLWYPSCFAFLVRLNALPRNILSIAVLLGRSLKSP